MMIHFSVFSRVKSISWMKGYRLEISKFTGPMDDPAILASEKNFVVGNSIVGQHSGPFVHGHHQLSASLDMFDHDFFLFAGQHVDAKGIHIRQAVFIVIERRTLLSVQLSHHPVKKLIMAGFTICEPLTGMAHFVGNDHIGCDVRELFENLFVDHDLRGEVLIEPGELLFTADFGVVGAGLKEAINIIRSFAKFKLDFAPISICQGIDRLQLFGVKRDDFLEIHDCFLREIEFRW